MVRPLWMVVAAISLSRPELPADEIERYAQVLIDEARQRDFDPFTGVAIIHRESGWRPGAVSRSGEDYGLGQIRARYVGACRHDEDPLHAPSAACRAEKERLLDGEANIRAMAEQITRHRDFCRKKVGSAAFARWLASYQGRNYPKQNRWCQPGAGTTAVIEYRRHLITAVGKMKPPAPDATPAAPSARAAPPKPSQPR